MSIPVEDNPPVGIFDPVYLICSRWTSLGAVVLCTTENIIERFSVIQCQFIKLSDRKVFKKTPGLRMIETFVQAAVRTHKQVVGIIFAKSNRMIVRMFVLPGLQ